MTLLCYLIITCIGSLIGHFYFDGSVFIGGFIGFMTCLIIHMIIKGVSGESIFEVFTDLADGGFDGGSIGGGFDGGFDGD